MIRLADNLPIRRFYFPPPTTPSTDIYSNADELSKYLATGADLGPLQGFVNAVLKTLGGDLGALPAWIQEQTEDWLDDFSDWFLNLGASFNDLMLVFNNEYNGDDIALLTIQSVLGTIKSVAGGLIDLSRLPAVPLGSLTLNQPNLLLNPQFDGSISMDGDGIWEFDEHLGRTNPGSARAVGDGARKVLTSNPVESETGQKFKVSTWVKWSGIVGSGDCFRLVASAYQGDTKLADTVIGSISGPAANGGWSEIAGNYIAPANTEIVRVYLEVTASVTEGAVWFDDAELRKTATSLPMEWINDLLPQLSGLWSGLESLVNNALTALGIIGEGSLMDRILDLADEFGNLLDGVETGAADLSNLISGLLNNPASLLGNLPQSKVLGLVSGLNDLWGANDANSLEIEDLQDKTQKLEGVVGYRAAYMPEGSGTTPVGNWKWLGFTATVGPQVGTAIGPDGGITLLSKGLWRSDTQVYFSWETTLPVVEAEIVVFDEFGVEFGKRSFRSKTGTGGDSYESIGLNYTFVVPRAGFRVFVRARSAGLGREILTGLRYTSLTVNKWSSETS